MKKIVLIAAIGLIATGSVYAQQKWTLEQCIQHAIDNNLNIKSSVLTNDNQAIELEKAKNQRLPSLDGSLGTNMNFGTALNSSNNYVQQNSQSGNMGLNASVVLFSGFRIKNTIAAQEFNAKASREDVNKAKENMAVEVAQAYLQVLYNKELEKLALEQVALSEELLRQSEIKASLGKIPGGQVYEVKAQLAKDKLSETDCKSTLQLSLLDLSQLLELKEWKDFDIAEPLLSSDLLSLPIQSADDIYRYASENKSEVKSSEYRVKSSEKNVDVAKGGYYPSVSLGASYSNRLYSEQNASIAKQLDINGGSGIGLNVSIPIFNRFDTKNSVRQSKLSLEKAKLELESTKKTLYKEIQQAWFNADKAVEKYNASSETVTNTQEAFRFAEEKFNNGRATLYEYNQAKVNLASAKSNQLQAKYNLLFCIKILDFYKGDALKF
jgi:outer membrane protein